MVKDIFKKRSARLSLVFISVALFFGFQAFADSYSKRAATHDTCNNFYESQFSYGRERLFNHELIQSSVGILEKVATDADLARGLSDRPCLLDNYGMLFDFKTEAKHGIWMKDMKFSLDIVWLDAGQRIVHIKENALPASYPEVFSPTNDTRYVIELPAGVFSEHNLKIGDEVNF